MSKVTKILDRNYFELILLHIGIGIVVFLFKPISIIYFLVALGLFLIKILFSGSKDRVISILLACSYFVGAEVFFRMTKGGISYESSKYLVILFVVIGMFYKGLSGKGYPYFIYLILLVPSILVASITLTLDANFRTNVAFVLSGPVCLGIASLFCYDRKVSQKQVLDLLFYMMLPIITTTSYLFLYNPSIKDTLTGTSSNSAMSGGFGPNQVATVLGLGMAIMIIRLFLRSPNIFVKLINLGILGAMTFRAFMTFSRGGIFAAIIVVSAFLVNIFFKSSNRQKNQIVSSFILLFISILITWLISSSQTSGLIDKRYANQDSLGRDKGDITTGRSELFMEEINGFLESPFLGVGASRMKNIRVETTGEKLPSHNEIGRLLSEHGLLGLVILMFLIFTPISYRSRNKKNIFFYAFLAFWFATINHSGLRIAAPSFIYALSLLNVTNEKNNIYRKQIKK